MFRGRFLSADPFVGDAGDAQDYNRYSYVSNNPLNATDPSGYFSLKDGLKIAAVAVAAFVTAGIAVWAVGAAYGATLGSSFMALVGTGGYSLTFAGAVAAGVGAGFASGFAGSLLNGGSIGDAFRAGAIGGVIGGITGGLTHGIGTAFQGMDGFDGWAGRALSHGVVQGGATEAQGGEFRHGFYAGFASSAFAGSIQRAFPESTTGQTVAAALVGGTASALGGGKFANGAISGAFTYLLNHAAHKLSGRNGNHLVLEFDKEWFGPPKGTVDVEYWRDAYVVLQQLPDNYYDSVTLGGHGVADTFGGGKANTHPRNMVSGSDFDYFSKWNRWPGKQDENILKAFIEIRRVLKPGGTFIYMSCLTFSGNGRAGLGGSTEKFLGKNIAVKGFSDYTTWSGGSIYTMPSDGFFAKKTLSHEYK